MLIVSYRHTERGIQAARKEAAALKLVVSKPSFVPVPDRSLIPIVAVKFEAFADAICAEFAALWPDKTVRNFRARYEVILRRFVRVFNVSVHDLYSERRDKQVAFARQAIYYWTWRLTRLSAPQIGQRMGGRDHTTILRGVYAYRRKRSQMGRYLPPVGRRGK